MKHIPTEDVMQRVADRLIAHVNWMKNKGIVHQCLECKGHHVIQAQIPTSHSQWCKGVIDLGIFLTAPCHTCHPKWFKQYMTEYGKRRKDAKVNCHPKMR